MPVIRTGSFDEAARARLVSQLATELVKDPAENPNGEPLVVELPVFTTGKLQSVVIWSEWDRVPWPFRGLIIADAYKKAIPDRVPQLTSVTGVTWDEADSNAFFKYKIEPNYRAGEANDEVVRKAMIEEGAFVSPSGTRLRFFDRTAAETAYNRLTAKLPNAHWSLAAIARVDS